MLVSENSTSINHTFPASLLTQSGGDGSALLVVAVMNVSDASEFVSGE